MLSTSPSVSLILLASYFSSGQVRVLQRRRFRQGPHRPPHDCRGRGLGPPEEGRRHHRAHERQHWCVGSACERSHAPRRFVPRLLTRTQPPICVGSRYRPCAGVRHQGLPLHHCYAGEGVLYQRDRTGAHVLIPPLLCPRLISHALPLADEQGEGRRSPCAGCRDCPHAHRGCL